MDGQNTPVDISNRAKVRRIDNRMIYLVGFFACMFAAGMAYADAMPDPVTAAERIDKLGAMGVLAFGFILSMGGLIYLIRLQYGKMLTIIEKNNEVTQKVVDAIEKCGNGRAQY